MTIMSSNQSYTYRPCLLLLSFFSKIQSRPFFADFPFMFLNRHLCKNKQWLIIFCRNTPCSLCQTASKSLPLMQNVLESCQLNIVM